MLKSSSRHAANRFHAPSGSGDEGPRKTLRNASACARRLLEHAVREVDRLSPVAGEEVDKQRLSPPRRRLPAAATRRCRATSTSSRRRTRACRCASRSVRSRGRGCATARARSRDEGRRDRALRRGSRTPALGAAPPSRSTRCASRGGPGPTATARTCPLPPSSPSRARSHADSPCAGSSPPPTISSGR